MMFFKIGKRDFSEFVQTMKINMEVLVAENSGRNANGDTVIDIVNRKDKVSITFKPMNSSEMGLLLSSINDFTFNISYLNPKTNTLKTINCYINTPTPEFYCIQNGNVMYKPLSINFIEM